MEPSIHDTQVLPVGTIAEALLDDYCRTQPMTAARDAARERLFDYLTQQGQRMAKLKAEGAEVAPDWRQG